MTGVRQAYTMTLDDYRALQAASRQPEAVEAGRETQRRRGGIPLPAAEFWTALAMRERFHCCHRAGCPDEPRPYPPDLHVPWTVFTAVPLDPGEFPPSEVAG